ncbi:hypothetical protein UA08_00507 [Talaromyces atroroseus]|uniref:Uncharacterized protein n=1 Tax=Talaromyces atroroseus TaxID=1441469 RepID=A0A225B1R8_TALAT|nr:hypothetical protein UA08_00507 [Talaromyces atroroseus]OKL63648.1 hypothetical protein UA08_00507 [Talaromyces atroroseus]
MARPNQEEIGQGSEARGKVPTCRDRLWRSEIEAAIESTEAQAATLEDRRRQRTPCRCPGGWGHNQYDFEVNMIFSDRAETSIHYDSSFFIGSYGRPKKKYEQPDRVYGLVQTENFKVLLDSADKRVPLDEDTRILRHTLESSPFKRDREPLLFPFLIVEAKPDTVGDSAAVEMQTAFCIRRLLMLQDGLRAATGVKSRWHAGSLVWFFAYHGNEWSIKASFTDYGDSSIPSYCTVDLWKGDICNKSCALQLLLIVDYIFDWARDVYRQSILTELHILTGRETLSTDPDIFSTIGRRNSRIPSEWPNPSQEIGSDNGVLDNGDDDDDDEKGATNSPLITSRQSLGIVKDASTIRSRFLSLQITEKDIDSLLLSFATVEAENNAVRTMIQCLDHSWRMTAEALSGLEGLWSNVRLREDNRDPEDVFHVRIVILMHVSVDWVPVRQLTYLAISEGALKVLMSRTGLSVASSGLQTDFVGVPAIKKSEIEAFVASIMEQSIVDNLTAATSMLCLSSHFYRQAGKIPKKWHLKRSGKYFVGFSLDGSPSVLELVETIYESHKIGRREPTDPYIRFSQNEATQTIKSREFCMWPQLDHICQDTNGCALVDGLNLHTNGARYCLYILTRRDFEASTIPYIVESLAEGGLYYSTMQIGPNLRPGQYFKYLNEPTISRRLWRDVETLSSLREWIEGLKQTRLIGETGETPDSPIVLSSDEESMNDDYMDED